MRDNSLVTSITFDPTYMGMQDGCRMLRDNSLVRSITFDPTWSTLLLMGLVMGLGRLEGGGFWGLTRPSGIVGRS